MATLINHAVRMTFRDIAIAALAANGLDADTVLMDFVTGKRSDILTVEHEGTSFEFKKRGCSVNFELVGRISSFCLADQPLADELVARIKPDWLEIAFMSDH